MFGKMFYVCVMKLDQSLTPNRYKKVSLVYYSPHSCIIQVTWLIYQIWSFLLD